MTCSHCPVDSLQPISLVLYINSSAMSYFLITSPSIVNYALFVWELTAWLCFSSSGIDYAILIWSEYFSRKWCVYFFSTLPMGKWSPSHALRILSTCSFNCQWLSGKTQFLSLIIYTIITSTSSGVSHAFWALFWAQVFLPFAWLITVGWFSLISFPISHLYLCMNSLHTAWAPLACSPAAFFASFNSYASTA